MGFRFGLWSARSLYRTGLRIKVAKEMFKYELDLVGVHEDEDKRWH
jgi:hypothetical protein